MGYAEFWNSIDLPFIRRPTKTETASWWHVQPSGDYLKDCRTGEDYALAYMAWEYTRPEDDHVSLQQIVVGMERSRRESGDGLDGIAIGFLCAIANVSISAWHPASIERARRFFNERRAEADAMMKEHEQRERQMRIDRARKGGLAVQAKRRQAREAHKIAAE